REFLFLRGNDRCNKAIPLAGNCLDKLRLFGIVLQDLANLADGAPDAVIGVEENSVTPNFSDNLLAGNNLAPVLKQKNQDLQRNTFQFEHMTVTAQPTGMDVKLELLAEPDWLLHFDWIGSHGRTGGRGY